MWAGLQSSRARDPPQPPHPRSRDSRTAGRRLGSCVTRGTRGLLGRKATQRPDSDLRCPGGQLREGPGAGGGAQRRPGHLGHAADPPLPLGSRSSGSRCFTVEPRPKLHPSPQPEPHQPPQLGPVISASWRGGDGERPMTRVSGALQESRTPWLPRSPAGPTGPLIGPWKGDNWSPRPATYRLPMFISEPQSLHLLAGNGGPCTAGRQRRCPTLAPVPPLPCTGIRSGCGNLLLPLLHENSLRGGHVVIQGENVY